MKRTKRTSASPQHLLKVERVHIRRKILIIAMGGECVECGVTEDLEFHHTSPREWKAAEVARWSRQAEYEKEFLEGKLKLLCSSCNKRAGMPEATNGEVPF